MARRPQLVPFEASGFALDDQLRAWLRDKFPNIDPEATAELFADKALAKGWVYANWPAAFRNYVRRGKEWGGVAYRTGLADPRFAELLKRAQGIGFRDPRPTENVAMYRAALDTFDRASAAKQSALFGNVIKRFGKDST